MKSIISEFIPLSIPHLGGNEWKYVKECLDTNWVSSVGSFVSRFEEELAVFTGSSYAVATVNGTSALHISLILAGVEAGDYVIMPNITFVASANSIKYAGAEPILIDVDERNWQMDLNLLEDFLLHKTEIREGQCVLKENGRRISAVMPVHVLGNMCDMERLLKIAHAHQLPVVEDSTEALGTVDNGQHAGTFGKLGCFSFNGNKILTTGGGGMIVTADEALAKRAKHLTTQAKTDPIEYTHDEIGYNYRMVNILAAMGVAQLEQLPQFLNTKKRTAQLYQEMLASNEAIRFQSVSPSLQVNNWLVTIRTPFKQELFEFLSDKKIQSRPLWTPMNQLPMFADKLYIQQENISATIHKECLSLPSSSGLSEDQIVYIASLIQSFFDSRIPNN